MSCSKTSSTSIVKDGLQVTRKYIQRMDPAPSGLRTVAGIPLFQFFFSFLSNPGLWSPRGPCGCLGFPFAHIKSSLSCTLRCPSFTVNFYAWLTQSVSSTSTSFSQSDGTVVQMRLQCDACVYCASYLNVRSIKSCCAFCPVQCSHEPAQTPPRQEHHDAGKRHPLADKTEARRHQQDQA